MIKIIAARAANNVIGKNNELPWYFPEDLKWFKTKTAGKPVVMGWNTFVSIVARLKKPLPGRPHFVLTSKKGEEIIAALTELFPELDVEELMTQITFCKIYSNATHRASVLNNEVYVIGGERVYTEALRDADVLELTEVKGNYEGDAFFPEFDLSKWDREELPENMYDDFSFVTYRRKR